MPWTSRKMRTSSCDALLSRLLTLSRLCHQEWLVGLDGQVAQRVEQLLGVHIGHR